MPAFLIWRLKLVGKNAHTKIGRVMIGFPSKWASWPDKKEDPVRLVQTSNRKKNKNE